ncbi:hypothetical protein SteCoe_37923 [Stentor coeruleus]|uniref:Transmembrane protein n=1 Tax=Stentor coeruleus TaxID=5963 RepID=A0A1R2AM84_9CILI|nr:hypothetical protein SteCoe_37923 [Stentor coeruleus]
MQLKQTFIGGICTVILLGACTIILVSVCLIYISDNITEVKSLMPLVVLENNVDKFTADFYVIFTLQNYGDSCVSQFRSSRILSSRHCSENIYIKVDGINSQYESINCSKIPDNSCQIFYKCSTCELDLNSNLKLILAEDSSYSTGIIVNVTSDSSIPESQSSVSMSLSPTSGRIFIGSEASQFYLSVIPSYFTSTISKFSHELTGYHLSPASSPLLGSENFIEDLPVATQLSVIINFNKVSTGLFTSRYQTQNALIFMSGLFGTLSGLTGIVGIIMSKFEGLIHKRSKKIGKKMNLKKIIKNLNICQMNFKETKEEENHSNFHISFVNPTSAFTSESLRLKMPARSAQSNSKIF